MKLNYQKPGMSVENGTELKMLSWFHSNKNKKQKLIRILTHIMWKIIHSLLRILNENFWSEFANLLLNYLSMLYSNMVDFFFKYKPVCTGKCGSYILEVQDKSHSWTYVRIHQNSSQIKSKRASAPFGVMSFGNCVNVVLHYVL